MGALNILFLVLAALSAAIGTGLMIAMTNAMQARGQRINLDFSETLRH